MRAALLARLGRFFRGLRSSTPVWTTKDRRKLKVTSMTDDHLKNCVRAIRQGRLFPPYDRNSFQDKLLWAQRSNNQDAAREKWL